jgi:hypothetical protein
MVLAIELVGDVSRINSGREDNHLTDVLLFGGLACLLGGGMGYEVNRIYYAIPATYFATRVLLYDYWINLVMEWPTYHFRNKGFDRFFYEKPVWYVWTLKSVLCAILNIPLIYLLCQ